MVAPSAMLTAVIVTADLPPHKTRGLLHVA